ncbi:Gpi16 subunit GPI transamidase component [Trametes versicolor FP-101664 SS1]|uniref:Gpi16 subunit GPI transamidase component n=1 Tax=Trametes versicolor (strain FP-101664) TaxID=717944 RepID=UPI00046217CE|nr:Gpi16 subunit GPI transamidase component [Trametes versicolor FP-101664 SS1]EIW59743.1 Gpi16 subunit GPI transamidase component [Trametes versicolor FP-101664 SS1]
MNLCWRACFLLVLNLVAASAQGEVFEEDLTLHPLRDGKLQARFSFTTLLKGAMPRDPQALGSDDEAQHYTLFPLALGQILREHAVTELHLTLNAGKWNYDHWGYPDEPGVGTGAELWVWMGDTVPTSVDQRWQGLRNALAGLFCASLGHLDEQRTTSPTLTFQPEGSLPNFTHPHRLRHASLPSEHVCTENLTPFLKLLPCKSLSGIASLLNPHKVFDADWHGLGVHVRHREGAGVEVRLAFQAVFDPVRYSPDGRRDWSLRSVFDRSIERTCPVARASNVRVELPSTAPYSISPGPTDVTGSTATYAVDSAQEALDISMRWPDESRFEYPRTSSAPPLTDISVRRNLKGTSQAEARLTLQVTNNLPVQVSAGYLETMPWHLQFYLHTLTAHIDGAPRDDLVNILSYTPPIPHSRPALLQTVLTLPPHATLHLSVEVSKPFLRYTEHPPDAQRGWDLPPAVLVPFAFGDANETVTGNSLALGHRPRRIYTPAMLVDLATPDFSMPYNVIIMSCTLIALIFGSVFNLLTRRFVVVQVDADADPAPEKPAAVAGEGAEDGTPR